MTDDAQSPDGDIEAVRQSLLAWKAAGNPDPQIYVDAGEDGAGVYGLNDLDQLVRIHGATVEDTVSVSSGGGVETDRTEAVDG